MRLRAVAVAVVIAFIALGFSLSPAPASASLEADLSVGQVLAPPSQITVNTGFGLDAGFSFRNRGPSPELAPAFFSYTLTGPPDCTPFSRSFETSISFGSEPGLFFVVPLFCSQTGLKTFVSRVEFLPGPGVTDPNLADNVSIVTFDVLVVSAGPADSTPPLIVLAQTPSPNAFGWNNTDVTVSWSVSDPESGIASSSGCGTTVLTAETAGAALTCSATNGAGLTGSASVTVRIDKTAPVISINTPPPFAVLPVGTALDFTAADALSGLQSLVAELCDGTSCTTVSSGFAPTTGVYKLTVQALDSADNLATETRSFVIYDPSAGFATGGGWIIPGGSTSDTGDMLPGLDGTSRAEFGFVVKYLRGANTPGGQLQFQYRQGNLNLHSSGMDWLVIVNSNWAKFQGAATIKGLDGLFPFRVDARDGNQSGGNQNDRFVIRIWAPGANPDLADPIYKASGDLQGGSIIIHPQ